MKTLLSFIFLVASCVCHANMASPIDEGTFSSSALSSRDIDILGEKIHVSIDDSFKTAKYRVEYNIQVDSFGNQIPLLFHAENFLGDFKVSVDGIVVGLLEIPSQYQSVKNSPFLKFSNYFKLSDYRDDMEVVTIFWEEKQGYDYYLEDLKYFETDLSKGQHKILVEYVAEVRTDRSDWVKEYSFRYSLSPAKHWKSFNKLEIIIDAPNIGKELTTNLGNPSFGKLEDSAKWVFSALPFNYFEIIYKPQVSAFTAQLISLSPSGLSIILAFMLIAFHIFLIWNYRKNHKIITSIGSFLIPFIVLAFYVYAFGLIDDSIGKHAGKYHGYTFLVFVFYPIIVIVYYFVLWAGNKILARTK